MATGSGWENQSFAEYMSFVTGGEDDFTKLFTKRLSDGTMDDSDFQKFQKKTGFSDKQINRLSEKFINELSDPNYYGSYSASGTDLPVSSLPVISLDSPDAPPIMGPETPENYYEENNIPEPTPMPSSFGYVPDMDGDGLGSYVMTDEPAPVPSYSPTPTPEPAPERYTPPPAFDAEGMMESINAALAGINRDNAANINAITSGFESQIAGLTNSYNANIANIQSSMADQSAAYQSQIEALQGTLAGNQSQLDSYASQISSLGDQLREAERNARQVKVTDTTYIGDNTASGVRFNRSNNYNRGAFALGTGQLNRRNRNSQFSINTVNL